MTDRVVRSICFLVTALTACGGTAGTTTGTTTGATSQTSGATSGATTSAVATGATSAAASSSTSGTAATTSGTASATTGSGTTAAATTGSTHGGHHGATTSGGPTSAGATTGGTTSGSIGTTGSSTSGASSSSGSGNSYYVSPTGDDSAAGTLGAPWATIQNAGIFVQPGDTVIVEAGTYDAPIFGWDAPPCPGDPLCVVAGTPTAPIVFEADPTAAAGAVVIGGKNGQNDNGFDLEPGCDYVNIVGFTVNNNGTSDQGMGTITKAGIAINGNGDQVVGNTVDGVSGIGGILVNGVDGGLVQGNTCTDVQGTGSTGHGMYISASSTRVQVLDNLIYDNDYVGIHLNGDVSEGLPGVVTDCLIAGNVIYGNGQNGINADGLESSVLENNVIYDNARNGIELYEIDAYGGSSNNVIVNNTIDQSMVSGAYAIEVSACGYDNQSSEPTPDNGCQASPFDSSLANLAFNNVLLGGSGSGGVSAVVASDDLYLTNNLTSAAGSLFVNAAGGNYTLAPGGPGIGAGVAAYDGGVAPAASGGSYDIGAFSFGLP